MVRAVLLVMFLVFPMASQAFNCKSSQLAGNWIVTLTQLKAATAGACAMTFTRNGYVTSIRCNILGGGTIEAVSNSISVGPNCTLTGDISWSSGATSSILASISKQKDEFNGVHLSVGGEDQDSGTFVGMKR